MRTETYGWRERLCFWSGILFGEERSIDDASIYAVGFTDFLSFGRIVGYALKCPRVRIPVGASLIGDYPRSTAQRRLLSTPGSSPTCKSFFTPRQCLTAV